MFIRISPLRPISSLVNLPTACAPPVWHLWIILSTKQSTSIPQSSGQGSQQVLIVLADALLFDTQIANASAGMQHRRVITPAECVANLRQAVSRQFFCESHCYLARTRDGSAAAF